MSILQHLAGHIGLHAAKDVVEKKEKEADHQTMLAEAKQKDEAESKAKLNSVKNELRSLIENNDTIPESYRREYSWLVIEICTDLKKPDYLLDFLLGKEEE